ncbi:hypothetical protein P3F89_27270 (plasmid) [Bacillus tropicus]|uniref:Uncharacterized protein n=1 Tax=Bacillus tropicus TaxID=2026188 RepID=A0ABD7ZZI3_9BACI|nr:hypothetical protein [Bacillus tropicus]WMY18298.1 hypothetical protein P3F89_27270 [Bacillus tropicus]
MVCTSVWVSKSLMGSKEVYDIALQDQLMAKGYWKVGFTPRFRVLPEDNEANTFKPEDIVVNGLNTPQGTKLKNLFLQCIGDPPCYDDPMTSDDSLRTLNVFYLNIDKISDTPYSAITYSFNEHVFIVMTTQEGSNYFSHEFGHALYHTNYFLKGLDPISKKEHNDDPNNLMYFKVKPSGILDLKEEQINAKEHSALTNKHVTHDTPPPRAGRRNFSIE